jgi:hypothetical protein
VKPPPSASKRRGDEPKSSNKSAASAPNRRDHEAYAWVAPPPKLPKPEWWLRDTADADAMVAWVNERLWVRFAERMNKMIAEVGDQWEIDPETGLATIAYWKFEDRIIEAEQGNMEPLREAYPEIAAYINPRKRDVGEHLNRFTSYLRTKWAVEDVHFIRQLWRQEYDGKWKRGERNPPTATQIATAFHNVVLKSVESQAEKNYRRKPRI